MSVCVSPGTTSYITHVKILNSTNGTGLTGLAYNTSGLTCYYIKNGQSGTTQVTLASATLGTYTSEIGRAHV